MTDRTARVSVRILEKEYQVACLPEERSELLDSAEYLNGKMREIRDAGNIVGLDRIAVMAALNLAHELLKMRGRGEPRTPTSARRSASCASASKARSPGASSSSCEPVARCECAADRTFSRRSVRLRAEANVAARPT